MIISPSLIPELDDIVSRGDPKRRADAARRISELFLQGAASFRSDHVELFDGVLTSLVPHAEIAERAELAARLSVLANAPRGQLGQRDDLSSEHLKELLSGSIDVIRRRLFQVVKPERQAAIQQAMRAITGPSEREERRDFMPAQRTVLKLHREGMLGEGALLNFARAFKYEESIAALSAMTGVKIETLDRLISGDRYDPILIAGKSIDVEWATVRALILLRLGPNRTAPPADIESARVNYVRLMPSTAQRVVAF